MSSYFRKQSRGLLKMKMVCKTTEIRRTIQLVTIVLIVSYYNFTITSFTSSLIIMIIIIIVITLLLLLLFPKSLLLNARNVISVGHC